VAACKPEPERGVDRLLDAWDDGTTPETDASTSCAARSREKFFGLNAAKPYGGRTTKVKRASGEMTPVPKKSNK
jgi:hypothetical protein